MVVAMKERTTYSRLSETLTFVYVGTFGLGFVSIRKNWIVVEADSRNQDKNPHENGIT